MTKKNYSKQELCDLLKISSRIFLILERDGVFVKAKDEKYDLISNLKRYFDSLEYEKRLYTGLKNDLIRTKTEKEKTYVDKLKVKLVDKEEVYEEIFKEVVPVFNSIKGVLGSLAGRISIAYESQKQVHIIVHEELNKIYQQLDNELKKIENSKETTAGDYKADFSKLKTGGL